MTKLYEVDNDTKGVFRLETAEAYQRLKYLRDTVSASTSAGDNIRRATDFGPCGG
jgi:hypothetical protein